MTLPHFTPVTPMIFRTLVQTARYLPRLVATLALLAGAAHAQSAEGLYARLEAGRCVPAFRQLSAQARSGSLSHMKALGNAYATGRCTGKSSEKAIAWYRKAAEQGEASADYPMCLSDTHCKGPSQDPSEAISWNPRAGAKGHASAINNLGAMYEQGDGVQQDVAVAVKLYAMAARQGGAWGQRNLARMLSEGAGVAANPVQAHAWLSLAASADVPHPQAAEERDALAERLSPAQIAEARRLARAWKLGKPMGASRLKVTVSARTAAAPVVQGPDLDPGQPAQHRFNPFNSEWTYDSGSC